MCVRLKLTNRCRHLPPLQNCIFGDAAVRVDVDALVFVANQNLCSSTVWQNDDGMWMNGTLDLWKKQKHKQHCLDTSSYIKEESGQALNDRIFKNVDEKESNKKPSEKDRQDYLNRKPQNVFLYKSSSATLIMTGFTAQPLLKWEILLLVWRDFFILFINILQTISLVQMLSSSNTRNLYLRNSKTSETSR